MLAAHPAVSRVEDDALVSLTASPIGPSHMRVPPGLLPEGIRAIRARSAWAISQGEGVGVAIFDTGVDLHHPDLAPNIAGGINLVRPGTPTHDDNGHGTQVAGIVAAIGNTPSVIGVAPRSRLYAIKVLDAKGDGRLSDVILGLQWTVDQKVPIANMSLDVRNNSEALEMAVRNAVASGVTIVAATGNIGRPNSVTYPAAYPEVIAVSAVGCDGRPTSFASTGPQVDLAAPGVRILSTAPNQRYGRSTGTSVASPHVAGVAALYLALFPGAGPEQVRAALKATAVPLPGLTREQQGAGLIDALNAVSYSPPTAQRTSTPPAPQATYRLL